jgi:ubiquinone biosynthesis protein
LRDWEEVLGSLPRMARDVMRFAREKKFVVQLQHQHLEPSVNRLVFGLLTSALFVGSALLWANKAPPLLWDVSVVGAIGVVVSAVLGWRLLWAIQKSGKLED